MKTAVIGLVLLLLAGAAGAQAPAQDRAGREQAIARGQQIAGAAYRDLQQARHEAKLAEQDYLNAQQRADEAKQQLDTAKKAFDAARQKEAQARKAYDEALDRVDRARQPPPVK